MGPWYRVTMYGSMISRPRVVGTFTASDGHECVEYPGGLSERRFTKHMAVFPTEVEAKMWQKRNGELGYTSEVCNAL